MLIPSEAVGMLVPPVELAEFDNARGLDDADAVALEALSTPP